jgi:hypothetical protein
MSGWNTRCCGHTRDDIASADTASEHESRQPDHEHRDSVAGHRLWEFHGYSGQVSGLPERMCQLEVPRVLPDRFIGWRSTSAVDDPLAVLTAGLQKILAVNELGARR